MNPLEQRLAAVKSRLLAAELAAGRRAGDARLVAVSKTHPAETLAAAYRLGQRHFGENYLQEALDKQARLGHCDITWHFIGPIQSNKTRPIAQHFHWVHSVDRLKIAQRLSEQRPAYLPPLNVCLQVNVSGEDSKSGVSPGEAAELAAAVAALPRLRLRGLMAIPAPCDDPHQQRRPFAQLRTLLQPLQASLGLDTLSMGMTDDLEAAVQEGATLVRIGTAIFGRRDYGKDGGDAAGGQALR
ncbi:YggS family pyridoxal phosphate-dependent enzyme [Methylogaea oryzae]|uniref:Pyridoxal phosphate homeostasis protein n=1 Tax=Methylogaea oryzae TaxID=1295382 RepID=A0A8D4VMR2_9GAMM|nr:YggS family pyridoxal phosphate-dependent enzyme [Methylogaea oryzae]BBL69424.1 YggS family pyridoxal phosphate enzyme [Methylogaea oryzae]